MSHDENSLEALLHSGFRYALSLTHNTAKAEDVLQDAWLAVLKAKGPHQRQYLFSAIRTRFLNVYKREHLVVLVDINEAQPLQAQEEFEYFDMLDFHHVDKALAELRSAEREALFLMAVEGYTAQEVADFTGQARGTVLSHVHRAKIKVRHFFDTFNIEVRHGK